MKVYISGYGRMGHMVESCLIERGIEYAATEDICSVPKEIASECVCIDFTTPDAFRANFRTLAKNFKAVVVGTTGWYDIKDEVIAAFEAENTPMIYASNFSVGVNIFFAAVDYVSKMMGTTGGYMPYVEEKHHIHKLDRPSGTAKTLADAVSAGMGVTPDVASVRCGEIAGVHEVGFEGACDRITFRHEAFSRAGFASGAVDAAAIADRITGVHEFKDIIFNRDNNE